MAKASTSTEAIKTRLKHIQTRQAGLRTEIQETENLLKNERKHKGYKNVEPRHLQRQERDDDGDERTKAVKEQSRQDSVDESAESNADGEEQVEGLAPRHENDLFDSSQEGSEDGRGPQVYNPPRSAAGAHRRRKRTRIRVQVRNTVDGRVEARHHATTDGSSFHFRSGGASADSFTQKGIHASVPFPEHITTSSSRRRDEDEGFPLPVPEVDDLPNSTSVEVALVQLPHNAVRTPWGEQQTGQERTPDRSYTTTSLRRGDDHLLPTEYSDEAGATTTALLQDDERQHLLEDTDLEASAEGAYSAGRKRSTAGERHAEEQPKAISRSRQQNFSQKHAVEKPHLQREALTHGVLGAERDGRQTMNVKPQLELEKNLLPSPAAGTTVVQLAEGEMKTQMHFQSNILTGVVKVLHAIPSKLQTIFQTVLQQIARGKERLGRFGKRVWEGIKSSLTSGVIEGLLSMLASTLGRGLSQLVALIPYIRQTPLPVLFSQAITPLLMTLFELRLFPPSNALVDEGDVGEAGRAKAKRHLRSRRASRRTAASEQASSSSFATTIDESSSSPPSTNNDNKMISFFGWVKEYVGGMIDRYMPDVLKLVQDAIKRLAREGPRTVLRWIKQAIASLKRLLFGDDKNSGKSRRNNDSSQALPSGRR
ncbi:unnamed protein product [Amoebophrya sp. A120]|nr:unnamed protein product [Amoebophrya sp. A120]|eukprot:GSA120T00001750001.1